MFTVHIERITALHQDQRGTMSIVTVFTVLFLTMVLGMVMNVGREVDRKIRLQNAADAAAYSGGVVIARGMNTLAFANNLLCEMFGMVGFMREARDRNAEKYVPSILAAWNRMAPAFTNSPYAKLRALAEAIPQKTPLEQELVSAMSDWGEAVSEQTLPFVEEVLRQRLIPQFQRAVVDAYPDIAQRAAKEAAERNGGHGPGARESRRSAVLGVLWRTSAAPVGYASNLLDRTLPVVDPVEDLLVAQDAYISIARKQREAYSRHYLNLWNDRTFRFFGDAAKMCQFANIWRTFSRGYLNRVLDQEYPTTNLPFVMLATEEETLNPNAYLDQHFTFVAVVYWRAQPRLMPRLFGNPLAADGEAFAQVRVFVPHRRLVWIPPSGELNEVGGMPGEIPRMPSDLLPPPDPNAPRGRRHIGRDLVPAEWDLFNQNWTVQLVPATTANLITILQASPPVSEPNTEAFRLPRLGGLSGEEIGRISTH